MYDNLNLFSQNEENRKKGILIKHLFVRFHFSVNSERNTSNFKTNLLNQNL